MSDIRDLIDEYDEVTSSLLDRGVTAPYIAVALEGALARHICLSLDSHEVPEVGAFAGSLAERLQEDRHFLDLVASSIQKNLEDDGITADRIATFSHGFIAALCEYLLNPKLRVMVMEKYSEAQ